MDTNIRGLKETSGGGEGGCDGLSVEEMEDRMKGIAWEIEMEKNKAATEATADTVGIPESKKKKKEKKEPTREHLLLRECAETAIKWEKAMRARHTQGQAAEIVARIFENVGKSEFPSKPYHNWTDDLMEEAKTGWHKFTALEELEDKYPQCMDQMYCEDKDEWTMLD